MDGLSDQGAVSRAVSALSIDAHLPMPEDQLQGSVEAQPARSWPPRLQEPGKRPKADERFIESDLG
jgi:hypothetical protein